MQKIKWVCDQCGWTWRIDYHPSPENMDTMLGEVAPRHNRESPNCVADTGNIVCYHIEEEKNGS